MDEGSGAAADRGGPEAALTGALVVTAFRPREMASALGLGLMGLLVGGLFPLLLGGLAAEGRLSAVELGAAATSETLVLGLVTAACAAWLPPSRLRWIGAAAMLALALANGASMGRSHLALVGVRTLAGVPEGVLLWLAIGLITRTRLPERWTGVLTLGQPASQAAVAAALDALVLPRLGIDGGFVTLAALCVVGAAGAAALPRAYAPLANLEGPPTPLPTLGRLSLAAMAAYLGAVTLVAVFLGPMAAARGLSEASLSTAVTTALAAQTLGAVLATVLSGRLAPIRSLLVAAPVALGAIAALSLARSGLMFAAADAAFGFAAFYGMPTLVALAIQADPTRRSAMQSGAAQLLGSAAAPLLGAGAAAAGLGAVMGLAAAMLAASVGAFVIVARADRGRGARGDGAR